MELIKKYYWAYDGHGYAIANVNGKTLKMHNLIMKGKGVDHINHDRLDNRKENLRFATNAQNSRNQSLRIDNKTGFKGVSYCKYSGKYRAQIKINNERIHLGYFNTIEEAARAYDTAVPIYHGEYGCTNQELGNY